ncbi:hypothetical protein WAI453_010997 [Rhynchosporium graminicola]
MQFSIITTLIITMAAGAIAAPPHAVEDRSVLKRETCSASEIKRCDGKRCQCDWTGDGWVCYCL